MSASEPETELLPTELSPGDAGYGGVLATTTVPLKKSRSLRDEPTPMALGAVAGESIVFGSGPSLPAEETTITPMALAFSTACAIGSSSTGNGAGVTTLRLITSMPSATASLMACSDMASVLVLPPKIL